MIDREFVYESQVLIALAEAGWRGSPCWHVFEWLCWRQRLKHPLVASRDAIIGDHPTS